jgi:hypothetical protein
MTLSVLASFQDVDVAGLENVRVWLVWLSFRLCSQHQREIPAYASSADFTSAAMEMQGMYICVD